MTKENKWAMYVKFIVANTFKSALMMMIIAFILSGCSPYVNVLKYQSTPVAVDGNLMEWSLPLMYYDEDTKLNYSITNDESNLYIGVRAVDEKAQLRIIRGGFSIWIDISGKKNEITGIRYPLPERLLGDYATEKFVGTKKTDIKTILRQKLSAQTQMQVIGFKDADNGTSSLSNSSGITVAIKLDSMNILSYEAVIPFKTFYKDQLRPTDKIKSWGLAMVMNGVEMDANGKVTASGNKGRMRSGGGFSPSFSMGGGMRGGGMSVGGGGFRGGNGQRNELGETKTIWTYIKPTL